MPYLVLALTGLLGGISSGLFGVGGGVVFVPFLIILAGFNTHLAIGTSIAVIIPTAIMGAYRHATAGMIDWKTAGFLVLFAILGAWIGSGLSLKLDVSLLRKCYGVFLLLVSLKLFFQN